MPWAKQFKGYENLGPRFKRKNVRLMDGSTAQIYIHVISWERVIEPPDWIHYDKGKNIYEWIKPQK